MDRGWVIALGLLAVLGPVESAHADLYLDFDDWTDLCTTLAPGCDGAFTHTGPVDTALVTVPGDCFAGQCAATEFFGNAYPRLFFGDGAPMGRGVYFEAQVRIDVGAAGPGLMTGDRLRLLQLKDTVGQYEIVFLIIAPNHLQIQFIDGATGTVMPFLGPSFPIPGEVGAWRRVAVSVYAMDSGEARVALWFDDPDAPSHEMIQPLYDGTTPRTPGNWSVVGLGPTTLYSSGVTRTLYLDEICLGQEDDARTGYCLERRTGEMLPDAGTEPGDAAVADGGAPDSATPPEDSSLPGDDAASALDSAPGPSFRGSGGCACDAPGAGVPVSAAIPLLLGAFALCRRRRS